MFTIGNTVLVIIDVQGKLALLMHQSEQLSKNLQRLIQGAKILNLPILWMEQVPEILGPTIPEIAALLTDFQSIPKVSFSCYLNGPFVESLTKLNRRQVLIAGIETHICVYQTVVDLVDAQYEVQVIGDATSSRTLENKQIGLERIKAVGADVTSLETIVCELLRTSQHPKFSEILALIK